MSEPKHGGAATEESLIAARWLRSHRFSFTSCPAGLFVHLVRTLGLMRITLAATGDLLLSRDFHFAIEEGTERMISASIRNRLGQADIVLGNIEGVFTRSPIPFPKGERKPYYFPLSQSVLQVVQSLSLSVVTVANNHTMDFGISGLLEHCQLLQSENILTPGYGATFEDAISPAYCNIDGTIVAFISLCSVKPTLPAASSCSPGIARVDRVSDIPARIRQAVRDAREKSDVVIFSPHWIENWERTPSSTHRKVARELIDEGVDAILGHSSHLLHEVEIYQEKPIVYDMGTFLSDRVSGHVDLPHSALFLLSICGNLIESLEIVPVTLGPCTVHSANPQTLEFVQRRLENNQLAGRCQRSKDGFCIELKPTSTKASRSIQSVDEIHSGRGYIELPKDQDDKSAFLSGATTVDWRRSFENGIQVISIGMVDVVESGSGFVIDAVLGNLRRLTGDWVVKLKFQDRSSDRAYYVTHPFSQGRCPPCTWSDGDSARDYAVVRPPPIPPGEYSVFWALYSKTDNRYLLTIQGKRFIFAGRLFVTSGFVDRKCSGVDWDGQLAMNQRSNLENELCDSNWLLMQAIRERLLGFATPWGQLLEFEQAKDSWRKEIFVTVGIFERGDKVIRWECSRKSLKAAVDRSIQMLRKSPGFSRFDLHRQETGVFFELLTPSMESIRSLSIENEESTMAGLSIKIGERQMMVTPSRAQMVQLASVEDKIRFLCMKNALSAADTLSKIQDRRIDAKLRQSKILVQKNGETRELKGIPLITDEM